ncbi:MAG: hypothetical protein EAX87_11480 [Candidatus Thorarchaeota archaeon]|nr:hypothetical protein [Candidatus Thorarchaeota archaeon]
MSGKQESSWIDLLDDAIGIIVIVVAIIAVLELTISFAYAFEVLSLGLITMGIAWILWSVYILRDNKYARLFMFVTGLVAIIISLIDFIFLSLNPELLILYPAIAMLMVGTSRLVLGLLIRNVPIWIQMLQVLVGILTVNLAAFVFIFPNVGVSAMLILLVIALFANGLVRLVIGRTELKEKCMQPTSNDCD